ncbi:hypothetical protein TNCV_2751671 [Trichonephila clavipes]|nr:hypothetical protein TNCV_2751671 [Trichonephila clavipes]
MQSSSAPRLNYNSSLNTISQRRLLVPLMIGYNTTPNDSVDIVNLKLHLKATENVTLPQAITTRWQNVPREALSVKCIWRPNARHDLSRHTSQQCNLSQSGPVVNVFASWLPPDCWPINRFGLGTPALDDFVDLCERRDSTGKCYETMADTEGRQIRSEYLLFRK